MITLFYVNPNFEFYFKSKKLNKFLLELGKGFAKIVSGDSIEDLLNIDSENKIHFFGINSPSLDIVLLLIRFSNTFLIGAKFILI
jgi:hypothetical protein